MSGNGGGAACSGIESGLLFYPAVVVVVGAMRLHLPRAEGMPRRGRFVPGGSSLIEVTVRTIQSSLWRVPEAIFIQAPAEGSEEAI
jgi:hypothetical protein